MPTFFKSIFVFFFFFFLYCNKYRILELLLSYYHTLGFWYHYIPTYFWKGVKSGIGLLKAIIVSHIMNVSVKSVNRWYKNSPRPARVSSISLSGQCDRGLSSVPFLLFIPCGALADSQTQSLTAGSHQSEWGLRAWVFREDTGIGPYCVFEPIMDWGWSD